MKTQNCTFEEIEQRRDKMMTTIFQCTRCKQTVTVNGDLCPPTMLCHKPVVAEAPTKKAK